MKNLKEYIVEVYGNGWTSSVSNNLGGDDQKSIEQKIKSWCDDMKIRNYTINSKGEIDVKGDVWLKYKGIKELPYKFGKVSGDFNINYNVDLISLKNCPNIVDGYFNCVGCKKLTTLEGAPQEVNGVFKCNDCIKLKSLKGAPQKIEKDFLCDDCVNLKSLEGCPTQVDGHFSCSRCTNLTSLKGCPKKVGGEFHCYDCKKNFTKEEVESLCKVTGEIKTFNYESFIYGR